MDSTRALWLALKSFVRFLRNRRDLILENFGPRQQLVVLKRPIILSSQSV